MEMMIRANSEGARLVLEAAVNEDLEYLETLSDSGLNDARCKSGCTALHWAAGSNKIGAISYLVKERSFHVDTLATRKARGRTPLHYACRNGNFEAAELLTQLGANVNARAKHGVSPFQLAVWQNRIDICKWLVEFHGVDPAQVNDFDCGAIHWIGICPISRADKSNDVDENQEKNGSGLLPLAQWLARQEGVNFLHRQRQGHTAMHKAAWGGHGALLRFLRDEFGLTDEFQDNAGNYAADLADMANTERHSEVARFLREECSSSRARSCKILGVPVGANREEIRKAYLVKARQVHPDRLHHRPDVSSDSNELHRVDFEELHTAYQHLVERNGHGVQVNPAHSLNLMLELSQATGEEEEVPQDIVCFKARLIAVLLEYGEKGLDMSNVRKKWRQVWPDTPFPDKDEAFADGRTRTLKDFIAYHAGDVVDIILPKDGKGSIRLVPKHCTQEQVSRRSQSSYIASV